MLDSIARGILIFVIALALVAYRFLWGPGSPFVTRYLPKSWRRWLYDRRRPHAEDKQ